MPRKFSLAEARQDLEALLDEVARGEPVALLREGKVVAFVVSPELLPKPPDDFVSFVDRFRAEQDLRALDAEAAFVGLRDPHPGPEIDL